MPRISFVIFLFHLVDSILVSFEQKAVYNSCLKKSYDRGAGVFPNSCDANSENAGIVCYPKCQAGYNGTGPICWENCPSGFTVSVIYCNSISKIQLNVLNDLVFRIYTSVALHDVSRNASQSNYVYSDNNFSNVVYSSCLATACDVANADHATRSRQKIWLQVGFERATL
jgi:hypothetical protein